MIDADHFKQVNDQHGHLAGDCVLKQIAGRLKENVRDIDLVVRFGGEEFLILAPDCDYEGAVTLAVRICERIAQAPTTCGPLLIPVTVSAGAAVAKWPEHPATAATILQSADRQLYAAKHAGRNTYRAAWIGQDTEPPPAPAVPKPEAIAVAQSPSIQL